MHKRDIVEIYHWNCKVYGYGWVKTLRKQPTLKLDKVSPPAPIIVYSHPVFIPSYVSVLILYLYI